MNKQNIQYIIDNLKSVEEQANKEGAFDINEPCVNNADHVCGTVHCVAGWYAVACKLHEKGKCTFNDGGNLMSQHFFGDDRSVINRLKNWAELNALLWGNYNGYIMFNSLYAYNSNGKNKAETFSDVIQHWEEVRDRVEEHNINVAKIKNQ